ncbi:MAG TPA: CinA family nicotinamide mononucleotide deamidase-related protein [Chthoniobacteraceae bacterium]|nr:CinA family nicotinamide mononucleotide deamidase-related protein [Chthoniobacteraceae bacterium]
MNIEVLNTGTELLLGSVTNTHLPFFAQALFPLGLRIGRQVALPDGEGIAGGIADAFPRAEVVLVTGGLGPTTDDITRDVVADLLGRPLRRDGALLDALARRYADRGREMPDRVARQAEVPEGAIILPNPNGTAPGLYLQCPAGALADHLVHLFLLPGPPRELYPMFEVSVVPILLELAPKNEKELYRLYQFVGIGESQVEAAVGESLLAIPGLELGYCARPGEVDVRCIGRAEALQAAHQIILRELGERLVSSDGRTLEATVVDTLLERRETIATAESCTGGALAHRLTNVPGASGAFIAGYVTYSNEAKSLDLGVNPLEIERHGAVSREIALAMAEGALRRSGTDWALSTTGIAGPGGATAEKPLGTVYIALARRGFATHVEHHCFAREREEFKEIASGAALDLLRRAFAWSRAGSA